MVRTLPAVFAFSAVLVASAQASSFTWSEVARLAEPPSTPISAVRPLLFRPKTADQNIYEALTRTWEEHTLNVRSSCVPIAFVKPMMLPRGGVPGDSGGRVFYLYRDILLSKFGALKSQWEMASQRFKSGYGDYNELLESLFALQNAEANLYAVYANNQSLDGPTLAAVSGQRAVTSWKMNMAETASRNISSNHPGSTYNCFSGTGSVNYGNEQAFFADHNLFKTSGYDSGFTTEVARQGGEDTFYVTYSLGSGASLASISVLYARDRAALTAMNIPFDLNRRSGVAGTGKDIGNTYDLSAKQIVQITQAVYNAHYAQEGMAKFVGYLLLDEKFRGRVAEQIREFM